MKSNLKIGFVVLMLLSQIPVAFSSTITSITMEVYPISGDITTDIILQVRGVPFRQSYLTVAKEYPVLYVFYDDKIIASRLNPITRGRGYGDYSDYEASWDVVIHVPNEYSYSELGTHIIRVVAEASDGTKASATTTFRVVNYFPPPEWWSDLPSELLEMITGPRGLTGATGPIGPKGDTGTSGESYPKEALYYSVGASTIALLISIFNLMKKRGY